MTLYRIVLDKKDSCKGFIVSQNRYKNGKHILENYPQLTQLGEFD